MVISKTCYEVIVCGSDSCFLNDHLFSFGKGFKASLVVYCGSCCGDQVAVFFIDPVRLAACLCGPAAELELRFGVAAPGYAGDLIVALSIVGHSRCAVEELELEYAAESFLHIC